jgi:two-component system cell cycle sensor histidine kinase/response regulator CckA
MKKTKSFEIAMICFSILAISALATELIAGSFFIFTSLGFFIYALLGNNIYQNFSKETDDDEVINPPREVVTEQHDNANVELFKLHSAFETSSFATFFTDSNFQIVWQNRFTETIPEFEKIKNTDSNFKSLIDTEAATKLIEIGKINDEQAIIPPLELRLRDNPKTILLHSNKVTHGDRQYFILNVIDITDHKTLEENFIHSQKMQALGQLCGSIAHDFNNILTAIIGFSDILLMRHQLGDPSFMELMQIKQNANRAANLVRQLLAFSRKQVIKSTTVDVTDTIAELSHLLKRLIGNNISLEINHGNNLSLINVNQGQLEQVLTNLVVNAKDAMPNGGELIIKTRNAKIDQSFGIDEYYAPIGSSTILPGQYVVISISDTGTGISSDILDKIFDPFFSTKNPESGSGTGLGLSTVNGITEQFGGHIRLKTIIGKGTTFYIFLKSADIETIEVPIIEQRSELTMTYEIPPKGKILIAEDEASIRMFSVHALKGRGFEVLEASSSEEAIEIIKVQGNTIDLLITDVVMKGMDGTELVEKVKFDYPNLKVLFMSGYAQDTISYISNSDYKFLSKPYTLVELVTTVNEIMKETQDVNQ